MLKQTILIYIVSVLDGDISSLFSALETLFPLLLIMDLLQRLSFWQTVRTKTTAAEEEEVIIEVNQEDGENRKETKTRIITEMFHPLTINVSIDICTTNMLLLRCINLALFILQVQLQVFHKLAHMILSTMCASIISFVFNYLYVFDDYLFVCL